MINGRNILGKEQRGEKSMPIGIIVNLCAVIFGGIIGGFMGDKLPTRLKTEITLVFGLCSMGMGINAIPLMENMPAVIFSLILGTSVGLLILLGEKINFIAMKMERAASKVIKNKSTLSQEEFMLTLVTIIVLFCSSGTGIYGCLDSGMSGDHTILLSKSILDFFTAMIFACNLGYVISMVAIPQAIIFFTLFYAAKVIYPLTTPTMINDFKACGGFIMIATGFRMIKVKNFPVADMIPSMIFVMPISWAWTNYIMPLF